MLRCPVRWAVVTGRLPREIEPGATPRTQARRTSLFPPLPDAIRQETARDANKSMSRPGFRYRSPATVARVRCQRTQAPDLDCSRWLSRLLGFLPAFSRHSGDFGSRFGRPGRLMAIAMLRPSATFSRRDWCSPPFVPSRLAGRNR